MTNEEGMQKAIPLGPMLASNLGLSTIQCFPTGVPRHTCAQRAPFKCAAKFFWSLLLILFLCKISTLRSGVIVIILLRTYWKPRLL